MVLGLRRTGYGDLAERVEGFLAADGIDDDRRGVARAEERDARVDLVNVDQSPRAQCDAIEPFAIRAHGAIIVGAGREIGPVSDGNVLFGDRLEVEHVERLARTVNQRCTLQPLLHARERCGGPFRESST